MPSCGFQKPQVCTLGCNPLSWCTSFVTLGQAGVIRRGYRGASALAMSFKVEYENIIKHTQVGRVMLIATVVVPLHPP